MVLEKSLYAFFRVCWKNCCFKSLGKLSEKVFSSVPFKYFELPNPPTYNYTENWLHRKCVLCLSFVEKLKKKMSCNYVLKKTSCNYVLKTSWKRLRRQKCFTRTNVCWVRSRRLRVLYRITALNKSKLPGRPAIVLEKVFNMDVLLHKNIRREKIKTLKGNKLLQCRLRCRCQCRCWSGNANAKIFKSPTINSSENLARTLLFLQ